MDRTVRACILFMSFVTLAWVLYWLRNIMAPFALAIFFWLIIDAFARWMDRKMSFLPYFATLAIAVAIVAASLGGIIVIIADTAVDVSHQAPQYQERLGEILNPLFERFSDGTWHGFNEKFKLTQNIQSLLGGFANSIQGVVSSFAFIAIYVAFLFAAQNSFPKKMDDLFPDPTKRIQAAKVGERIRVSIEKYLGIQTLMSLIMTALSFGVMKFFGLDNALFWALVIFILNYIPVVGSVLAGIFPAMFALVQFDSLLPVGIMAALLFVVQFVISNTVQPKMMGDSMNLSALVIILSLVLWQGLWGGVGAFLSAPLTVIMMIVLAQFKTTHWIAVLLSADGEPNEKETVAQPSL
ncbi:MAG: AI-2E family transporter [Robiginitomaculum sp.]|nr:MAG: AI-2E family transporter [Robiginitomaculum sp.]